MNPEQENVELHDDEQEIVEAAAEKMPVGTEDDSEKSVAKAAGATGKSPLPSTGTASHNTKQEPMPRTKAGMVNAMYGKMNAMKKVDLQAAYNKMMGEEVEMEDEDVVTETRAVEVKVDFSEDLNALIESEATLSEEFKDKTAVIFEAALKSKLSTEIDRLEEQYRTELDEEIVRTRDDMVEKVDSYLNYVVENWMEENKLAVRQGLRTEIAEDFMNGLKTLFTESYVDVPESKVDLVDELAQQVAELEESLNKTTESAIQMSEAIEGYQREAIIREHAEGLAATQIDKLRSLVEDVDFDDEESFSKKVKTVKESYFNSKKVSADESIVEETEGEADDTVETSSSTAQYLSALKRFNQ